MNKEVRSHLLEFHPAKSRQPVSLISHPLEPPEATPEYLEGQNHASVYLALLKALEDVIDVF
jgi:hypothetical protein